MYRKTRASLASTILAAMLMVLATIAGTSTASAAPDSRAAFAAEAREAGLSAKQASGLQNKIDAYLTKLDGQGTQVAPNQIDLDGAVLNVTVPGERQPRVLGDVSVYAEGPNAAECSATADYGWFCAYQDQYRGGDSLGMYTCGAERRWYIPWSTVGSWENNQSAGTQPLLTFTNGSTWYMPGAYYYQASGVDWTPVLTIRPCL